MELAENLRLACTRRRSISQVCREIGLNRQQFNRYLNGDTRPSAHNLARIAAYFELLPQDFDLDPRQFRGRLEGGGTSRLDANVLLDGFPGDVGRLRRYLGYYQTYHLSRSWPGKVVCSCSRLEEQGGMVHVKSIERIRDPEAEIQQYSKYVGLASYLRNRVFIVERTVGEQPLIAQTILLPFGEHQQNYLQGLTMGVSWRNQNIPYSAPMIWRYLGANPDKRSLLAKCGVVDPQSRRLPPTVRKFLQDDGNADKITAPLWAASLSSATVDENL